MSEVDCGFEDGHELTAAELLIELGPTLHVDIGFDVDYRVDAPDIAAKLPMKGAAGLIDTGAGISCIDAGLAMSLHLPVIERIELSGVGGRAETNMYLAQIHVPELRFTLYGQFAGAALAAGGQRHDVLIGRDFLRYFRLTYDGPSGGVTLLDPEARMETETWPDE